MLTALVTNARVFAGPPAVRALRLAGFQVVAHDAAFVDLSIKDCYQRENPGVVVLTAQHPAEIVESAWAVDGRLDVVVSNDAYPAIHRQIENASIDDLRATIEHLVMFPFVLAKAAIPRLIAQKNARVVMITSNRTRLQQSGGAIPDIARAGLNALVKSLSIELAPHEIPVNAIAPNYLYSETYYPREKFIDDAKGRAYIQEVVPLGRLARPEEIGELICYLATMKGSFLTGSVIDFSGGWPAARPRPV